MFLTVRKDLVKLAKTKSYKKTIPNILCPKFFEIAEELIKGETFYETETSIINKNGRAYLRTILPLEIFEEDETFELDINGIQKIKNKTLKTAANASIAALLKNTVVNLASETVWAILAESFETDLTDRNREDYKEVSKEAKDILKTSKKLDKYYLKNIKDAYKTKDELKELLEKSLKQKLTSPEKELAELLLNNIQTLFTPVYEYDKYDDANYGTSVFINKWDYFPIVMGYENSIIFSGYKIIEYNYESDEASIPLFAGAILLPDGTIERDPEEINFLELLHNMQIKIKNIKTSCPTPKSSLQTKNVICSNQ